MTMAMTGFAGFPLETQRFLAELGERQDRAWFESHRADYEHAYVEPAKAFVSALAPGVDELVPGIHVEPRILGSIFRINRDIRFSRDKRPYKDHLDLWFWEGDRKQAVSGLFVRIAPTLVGIGVGAHGFDREQIASFRAALADPAKADALVAMIADVESAGYAIGGATRKRPAKSAPIPPPAERFLLHEALFVHVDEAPELATSPQLVDACLAHWGRLAPLHRWLVASLRGSG